MPIAVIDLIGATTIRVAFDPLRHQFGVLDQIHTMRHNAGHQNNTGGQFMCILIFLARCRNGLRARASAYQINLCNSY